MRNLYSTQHGTKHKYTYINDPFKIEKLFFSFFLSNFLTQVYFEIVHWEKKLIETIEIFDVYNNAQ